MRQNNLEGGGNMVGGRRVGDLQMRIGIYGVLLRTMHDCSYNSQRKLLICEFFIITSILPCTGR